MTCPDCERRMGVQKSVALPGRTIRVQVCECGVRLETEETVVRKLPAPAGNQPATTGGARNGPATTGNPPATAGGVGGGLLSDPDPSGSSQQSLIVRSDRARVSYPSTFEVLWEHTGKRGSKYAALKAWERVGRPEWLNVQTTWRAYLLSEMPAKGFVQQLSTWLNKRGHAQEWQTAGVRPQAPPDRLAERTAERLRAQREAVDYEKIPTMADLVALRAGK